MLRVVIFMLFTMAVLISQTAMDILAVLLVLAALNHYKILWQNILEHKRFFVLCALFIFNVAFVYTLNRNWDGYAVHRLYEAFWFFVVLAFLGVIPYFKKIPNFENKFLALHVGLSFLALVGYFFLPFSEFIYQRGQRRLGGFYSDPMTWAHSYGQIFCVVFFISLGILLKKIPVQSRSGKIFQWLSFLATVFVGLSVLLTQTRGVWAGVIVAVLVGTLFISKKIFAALLALVLMGFVLLYNFWGQFYDKIQMTVAHSQTTDTERIALWRANWEIIKDNVWGVGWGKNKDLVLHYYQQLGITEFQDATHAHNQFIHFWAGTGFIGLLIYVALFVYIIRRIYRLLLVTQGLLHYFLLGLMALQIEFLVSGITECNFERGRVRYILLLSWACVLYLGSQFKDQMQQYFRLSLIESLSKQPRKWLKAKLSGRPNH